MNFELFMIVLYFLSMIIFVIGMIIETALRTKVITISDLLWIIMVGIVPILNALMAGWVIGCIVEHTKMFDKVVWKSKGE